MVARSNIPKESTPHNRTNEFMNLRLVFALAAILSPIIARPPEPCDCYPEVFQATNEWQVVREGQHIPAGLHVRMNMDTGEKEAKLLDPNDSGSSDLIVVENDEAEREAIQQKIEEALNKYKQQKKEYKRSAVEEEEYTDFSSALTEILTFDADLGKVEKALDTLVELSHDREYGLRLTQRPTIFEKIHEIALEVQEPSIKEKCYSVLGASLRNNPEAVANVLRNQPTIFIDTLFGVLRDEGTSDKLQKRVLGVVQGLSSNAQFAQQRLGDLIAVFPALGQQAKDRVAVILEDLELTEASDDSDKSVSNFIQQSLAEAKARSEYQLKQFYKALVELHEPGLLKPTKQFLSWLSEEIEKRKHATDAPDEAFNKFMLETRHTIFGNPNAARKADEL